MKTNDLFKFARSSRKLNESMEKAFGKKLNLEAFDLPKLEDARNRLRTQISQARSTSGFNENLENDAYHKAQWMLDAINAEIAERQEYIVDNIDSEEEQGEEMSKVTEGEIQQASAIVSAKSMADRVARWIEELSGMENETLLQLGDQIRDEMGQEQAKSFISAVAPAIQQAVEMLKTTRETISTSVRTLTGEEPAADMLGAEPEADMGDEVGPAEPDAMNMDELPSDDFGAADAAAGGAEAAGREKRESIEFQNRLMKVLAG